MDRPNLSKRERSPVSGVRQLEVISEERLDNSSTSPSDNRPSPSDFIAFVPWACYQLQVEENVVVKKVMQGEYLSASQAAKMKSKAKNKYSETAAASRSHSHSKEIDTAQENTTDLYITAMYTNESLTHIIFEKNKTIPRLILKIISLIIKFHPQVEKITIKSGMDQYTIYEISKLLVLSNITDICLDGIWIKEANYHILLDQPLKLRQLSLAKCKITDIVIRSITEKLRFPLPASKTLSILNLSTNKITCIGAKYIASVLRYNTELCYLNLASNMIEDDGAIAILKSLQDFCLSDAEITSMKVRSLQHLKDKFKLITEVIGDIKTVGVDKRSPFSSQKKSTAKSNDKDEANRKTIQTNTVVPLTHRVYYEKAETIVNAMMGKYTDPHGKHFTFKSQYGITYCKGNNKLTYLNLAYNYLTYLSLKKLLDVLIYQRKLANAGRKPIGLVNVSVEGNPLPTTCDEYILITDILTDYLNIISKQPASLKKRLSIVIKR